MRKEVFFVILLLIFSLLLLLTSNFSFFKSKKKTAEDFVIDDLKAKYPEADKVGILTTEEAVDESGDRFYKIRAYVVLDYYSKCPTRIHFQYSYPSKHFVARPPEFILKNCTLRDENLILFPEEAIVASYKLDDSGSVLKFVEEKDAIPYVEKEGDDWIVHWKAEGEELLVVVTKEGKVFFG